MHILDTIAQFVTQEAFAGIVIALILFIGLIYTITKLPSQENPVYQYSGTISGSAVTETNAVTGKKTLKVISDPRYVKRKAKYVNSDSNRFGRWSCTIHTKNGTKVVTRMGLLTKVICPATITYQEIK